VCLDCPHDFLHPTSGAGPKNAEEASFLWKHRKNRPAAACDVDREPPDGARMMREVKDMQENLKGHVTRSFLVDARSMAASWGLQMPGTGMTPPTMKDFGLALGALKLEDGSLDKETPVHMVCHHFHHQRQWLSDTVDAWLEQEKMRVLMPEDVGGEKTKLVDGRVAPARISPHGRGGFGSFARTVKADIAKRLMRIMLAAAGWCISTKDNSKQDQQGKEHELITIQLKSTLTTHKCFRVTCVFDAGKGNNVQLKKNGVKLQEAIDWGGCLCRHFGATATESELEGLWRDCKELPPSASTKPTSDANESPNSAESSAGSVDDSASLSQLQVNNSGAQSAAESPPPLNATAAQSFAAMSQLKHSGAPSARVDGCASTQRPVNTAAAHSSAAMSQLNNGGAPPAIAPGETCACGTAACEHLIRGLRSPEDADAAAERAEALVKNGGVPWERPKIAVPRHCEGRVGVLVHVPFEHDQDTAPASFGKICFCCRLGNATNFCVFHVCAAGCSNGIQAKKKAGAAAADSNEANNASKTARSKKASTMSQRDCCEFQPCRKNH